MMERLSHMEHEFEQVISSKAEIRSLFGNPSKRAEDKVISKIDRQCETLIEHSPFLVLSTSKQCGSCDASPRGDAPGFVKIVDENHLLIPERPGNKRFDSLLNILDNPNVGLLFLIPGMEETLRINGKAYIIRDQIWLEKMAFKGSVPLLGILVKVEEIFIHCAKAFIRSGLWNQMTWPNRDKLPTMGQILKNHAMLDHIDADEIDASIKETIKSKLY